MENYDFYYGTQLTEFERPEVPGAITKEGIKADIVGSKHSLIIKSSNTEAVILNVHN